MRRTLTALLFVLAVPALAQAQTEPTAEAVATFNGDRLAEESCSSTG